MIMPLKPVMWPLVWWPSLDILDLESRPVPQNQMWPKKIGIPKHFPSFHQNASPEIQQISSPQFLTTKSFSPVVMSFQVAGADATGEPQNQG